MLTIGFAGTRKGMTKRQLCAVDAFLEALRPSEVHHGDCVGADAQFHGLCIRRHLRIVIHPPDNPVLRAGCVDGIVVAQKPYWVRNGDIIGVSDIMIAAPDCDERFSGSGTWQVIHRAKALSVIIIYPEGYVELRKG